MKYFNPFLETLVDFFVANPTATRGDAIDFIRASTLQLTGVDAGTALDDLAAFYADLGLGNNANYSSLRNYFANEDPVKSKALLLLLLPQIRKTVPSVKTLGIAAERWAERERRIEINEDLQTIRDWRANLPNGIELTTSREVQAARAMMKSTIDVLLLERDGILGDE